MVKAITFVSACLLVVWSAWVVFTPSAPAEEPPDEEPQPTVIATPPAPAFCQTEVFGDAFETTTAFKGAGTTEGTCTAAMTKIGVSITIEPAGPAPPTNKFASCDSCKSHFVDDVNTVLKNVVNNATGQCFEFFGNGTFIGYGGGSPEAHTFACA